MKLKLIVICAIFLLLIVVTGFYKEENVPAKEIATHFLSDKAILEKKLDELFLLVNSPEQIGGKKTDSLKARLFACREAYKKIEWIISYYYPAIATRINGPDIMEEEDPGEYTPAQGLQVIENKLFISDLKDKAQLKTINDEIIRLRTTVKGLSEAVSLLAGTSTAELLAALKYEIIKISTLGLTEYDNPVQKNYLKESIIALGSVRANLDVFNPYLQPSLIRKKERLYQKAISFIQQHNDVDKFNRLTFITMYYIPLSQLMDEYVTCLKTKYSSYNQSVNLEAGTVFDIQSFNYFFNSKDKSTQQACILLGQKLFFDPILSGNLKRSCASCHIPEKGFTDGLSKSPAFDSQQTVNRNAPTIINACLQTTFFDDSRALTLERQIAAVINNPQELNTNFTIILSRLKQMEAYRRLFNAAFPGDSLSAGHITEAIASYERSLISFNSNFDQYIKGDKRKLTASQVNGFNLFMGKAKCGSCHFAPLFNGMLPPLYNKSEAEVIGALQTADFRNPVLDTDEGLGSLSKMDHQKSAFKVPTLRNAALTAPYMHNGSIKTLDEVLVFYNKGGAAGLGITIPNQTLSGDSLGLTKAQMKDIIHFIEALTDTAGLMPKSHLAEVY